MFSWTAAYLMTSLIVPYFGKDPVLQRRLMIAGILICLISYIMSGPMYPLNFPHDSLLLLAFVRSIVFGPSITFLMVSSANLMYDELLAIGAPQNEVTHAALGGLLNLLNSIGFVRSLSLRGNEVSNLFLRIG
jgi:hypothetical protein